jgi:hypothetical protein
MSEHLLSPRVSAAEPVPPPAPVKRRRSLIGDPEFRRRLGGITRVALWRLRKRDPLCPRPVKLRGSHLNLVDEDEADSYVEGLLAERVPQKLVPPPAQLRKPQRGARSQT